MLLQSAQIKVKKLLVEEPSLVPAEVYAYFKFIWEKNKGGGGGEFLELIREGSHLFSFIFPL